MLITIYAYDVLKKLKTVIVINIINTIIISIIIIILIITIYSLQTSTLQRLRKDYQIVDDYYTSRTEVALSSSTTSSSSSSSSSSSIQSKLPEQSNIATTIVASLPDSLSVVIDEMNGRVEQVGEIKYVFESSQNGIISGKYVLIMLISRDSYDEIDIDYNNNDSNYKAMLQHPSTLYKYMCINIQLFYMQVCIPS